MSNGERPDKNCKMCVYSVKMYIDGIGMRYICDYIGKTGRCRPCEYGDNCTVKVQKRGGKKRAEKL